MLRALPFGARNAVFVFGSVARCLEYILVCLLLYTVTQYVDDYPQLEPRALHEAETDAVVVFELFGWGVKKPDGQVPQFDLRFSALGVVLEFHGQRKKKVKVANKPERAKREGELVEELTRWLRPSAKVAETLHGVLDFARAQCFGARQWSYTP